MRDRHRLQASDISAALGEQLERLATDLLGAGPTSRSRAELRFRTHGSLAVTMSGTKRGIWCDHEGGVGGDALDLVRHLRGCSMRDAIDWAAAWLGVTPDEPLPATPRVPRPPPPPPAGDCQGFARALFNEARPAAGTLAEIYLRSRGCALPRSGVLRFHPACPRGERDAREWLPAMLAAMTDPVTNRFTGVHRTFLRPDGMGKVEHGKAKMMLGGAGVIRLAPDEEITRGLGICEGIETGLALIQHAEWTAIWAAGNAGAIAKFPVLSGIACLTVFPDADDGGASRKAVETCTARWIAAERQVQIIWPPPGTDWHDCLAVKAAA